MGSADFVAYFAASAQEQIDLLLEQNVKNLLLSFPHFKKGLPDCVKGRRIMLDSGAYSNQKNPGSVLIEDYMEFLKSESSKVYEFVTFDVCNDHAATCKNHERLLNAGLKPLFVDQITGSGASKANDFARKMYGTGDKMCWAGFVIPYSDRVKQQKRDDQLVPGTSEEVLDRCRERYLLASQGSASKLHILGVSSRARKFMEFWPLVDSIDAASWVIRPRAFGQVLRAAPNAKGWPVLKLSHWSTPEPEAKAIANKHGWDMKNANDRARLAINQYLKCFTMLRDRMQKSITEKEAEKQEDTRKIWKSVELDFEVRRPDEGLVLSPPGMAEAVMDGSKRVVVKSKPFELGGREFVLISQRKALGVVEFGDRQELDDEEFAKLEPQHLISDETRKEWGKAQRSWSDAPLHGWPVRVVEKFDKPRETNVPTGPQVIVHDVEIENTATEKIKDPASYNPSDANDAQLRDDFRIALAWYATHQKNPETFEHSLETIEKLLRKIVLELVRRGPEVIRFNPRGMAPSVRGFFEQVAADVKVPKPMYKALKLKPDTEPNDLTAKELDVAHKTLHQMYAKEAVSQQGVEGWSTEDIVNLHARLADRMFKLGGGGHPPPPDNGLDEMSADFEKFADKQPQWWTIAPKRKSDSYATIGRSGVKRGAVIKLDEVLTHLQTFKARRPYISLVGGLANHGETEGDIDILVNDTDGAPEWLKDVIRFRLGRALPPDISKRLEIHFDRERGPFTNHVELYDLHLERINTDNEIKEMRDESSTRAVSGQFAQQAQRAASGDKLTVGEFFHQPKPTRPAMVEELQTVESLLSLYKQHADKWLPTFVQKKYDGANHQAHVDGDKVLIISEDGEDNTDRLPGVVKELKELGVSKLIVPMEVEMWDGSQHMPREAIAGYLHSKDAADDSNVVANIYDVLYMDEDVHKKSTRERLELLKKLKVKQRTSSAPSLKYRLNAVTSVEADDLEELERAVQRIRRLPGSEGVVCKQVDAEYPPKQTTPDSWVKFHNATTIGGVVIDRTKTKGGVWVYQFGVLPGKDKPVETVEVGGKNVVPVGDTFATKRNITPGDGILVEAETVNVSHTPDGVKISAWVPRVIGDLDRKTDTLDQVAQRARKNLVLQEKDVDDKGETTYRTVRKEFVVEKRTTAELLVEAGPPNEWSGGVASALGEDGRKRVTALWNALSTDDKKKVMKAFEQMFSAIDTSMELEERYGDIAKVLVDKQRDPYMEIPPEDKTYRYSVQHHWRGKGVHADLRLVLRPKQLLIGWTMNTQIAGASDEPVTTLAQAKSLAGGMDKISKVNWNTGEWAKRPKTGTDKLVRTEILSERKAPEPFAWLDVEGKTKDPEPGKAPPVGGTRNHPGVFHLVDQGEVEYGAQKPWFHEYFFHGGGLNYRMFFRLLKVTKCDGEEPCDACGASSVFDVGWAHEQSAALCSGCTEEYVEKQGVVLPPSEEQGMREGVAWLAIYPDDPTPYVLGPEAVKKGWMPPDNHSALPRAVREQIPTSYQYWKKRGSTAKRMRDELADGIKSGDVKLDVEVPYKKAAKASMLDADFVLQEQTWRGPIQVRVGPTRTRWWVRLDVGRPELLVFDLRRSPLDNDQVAAQVSNDSHKDSMKISGGIPPGHYLNPTKETPSNLEVLDRGKAEVLELSKDLIKVRFGGKQLDGVYTLKRNDSEYLWQPSQAAPVTKNVDFQLYIPVEHFEIRKTKDGQEKRLVTGIVLEPNEVDAQNDFIKPDAIEQTAHDFLTEYNQSTEIGVMHSSFGDVGIELVESWVAPMKFTLGRKPVKKGSWVVTVHVSSDKRWEDVKSGKLNGFSVGGVATVKATDG